MHSSDFDAFFQALHDYSPFPWQTRLVNHLCEQSVWPSSLTLPTSSGKTAALDVALFHLILESTKVGSERRAPRRIYFVVDRRLVVDEAYDRSVKVAKRLNDNVGLNNILGKAAKRLFDLSGDVEAKPLQVIRLRGGVPLERSFIKNPLQPTIILTTVDQLGSRLLFRGYGVSANMRPIHAALTAMDSLILLDEAHLSKPFLQTLMGIDRYRDEKWSENPIKLPNSIVQMTATPNAGQETFSLLEDDYLHPLLNQRLTCAKPAELIEIKVSEDDSALAKEMAKKAIGFLKELQVVENYPVIGIVVNRVATARRVYELLQDKVENTDTILLTGRIRAVDRDKILDQYLKRMKSGRVLQANARPLFVVATQTIEVGADLDFDALVSEAASLDALRQRFGRLNRLGQRPHCRATVLYAKGTKDDPIYGEALSKTWKWLNEHCNKTKGNKIKQFDFGIKAMQALLESVDLSCLNMQQADAPILLPAHLDALVQTSPSPRLSPDSALLLHGLHSQEEDVQLVWRADLPNEIKQEMECVINSMLQALPPACHETLSVPLYAVHAFFNHTSANDIVDIEGVKETESRQRENTEGKLVYIWQGKDKGNIVHSNKIQPGNIVVMPANYKGADSFGWFPASEEIVTDLAEDECLKRRGKYYLRIHPNLVPNWFSKTETNTIGQIKACINKWMQQIEEGDSIFNLCSEILELALSDETLLPDIRLAIDQLLSKKRSEVPYPSIDEIQGVVLSIKQNVPETLVDDDDSTSMTREISLDSHCQGVADTARKFALGIGLAPELTRIIEQAALFHDLGKADPRFQALLQGGSLKHDRLLAKSDMNAADMGARQAAQKLAGYPQGQRHECYSVALLRSCPSLIAELQDPDLAQYLAGSHHGRGRPYMPAIDDDGIQFQFSFKGQNLSFDGNHALEKLDSGWVDLFWRMVRRYGYWGLAFLETIVRLADQQRSELESKHEQLD